jgi:peptidoglycan hydrolase-like protein with peptidoglycan-binding domain
MHLAWTSRKEGTPMTHARTALVALIAGLLAVGVSQAQTQGTGSQPAPQPSPAGTSQPTSQSSPAVSPAATPAAGSAAPARMGAPQEEVRRAQEALKAKGHDPGPLDGRMGPRTEAAIRSFQKAENIQMSGQLDDETRAKLGVN